MLLTAVIYAVADRLRQRTGLRVERVEFRKISFLNDTADMTLYYDRPRRPKTELAAIPIDQGAQ